MSLKTEYLDELNVLAKSQDVGALIVKLRNVMVGRHPATLSSEEQDPVDTVALAWKEVAARGRPSFEAGAELIVSDIEKARVSGVLGDCDWPLAHAVLRLLRRLPLGLVGEEKRARTARRLAGLFVERQELLWMLRGEYAEAEKFWNDAFRLFLHWQQRRPGWLETLWKQSLSDESWPLEQGAFVFLEEAARRHPAFITVDALVEFWCAAIGRGASIEDLRRWFYVVGALLEDSDGERLEEFFRDFEGHLQDLRHEKPDLPWDNFIVSVAALFRNKGKHEAILLLKKQPRVLASTRSGYLRTPARFKDRGDSVLAELPKMLMSESCAGQAH